MIRSHSVRHLGVQTVRRALQAGVLVLAFGLVALSLYSHYRAARAVEDAEAEGGWRGGLLAAIDDRVAPMEDPQRFLDSFKGSIWSMRFAGIDLSDPLAAAEMTAASKTLHVPLLLSILIPVLVTMLLGKVFCSWLCPAGLLFEVAGKLRKLLRFAEIPPRDLRFSHRNKYVLLVVGLVFSAAVGLPVFALVYPPAVLSRAVHAWVFGTALAGMILLLGVIVAFEVFVSPRWWCRSMCPGGALYGLFGARRLVRVRLDAAKCTRCGLCAPVCEPGIHPVFESEGIECDNCGVCVRRCPDEALRFTLGWARSRRVRNGVAATIVLAAWLIAPAPAHGHHILGLPHYSYKENYPQAPTLEYPATAGPYDVLLTSYPGKPIPGEPANIAFYIKNRNTDRPYESPVRVRVLRTSTFGRNREILPETTVHPFEVPYKISCTFPAEGEYIVELSFEVEGKGETIPFLMISGNPTAAGSILVAIGIGLAIFLVVVRAIRIKRARRARASGRDETAAAGAAT